MNTVHATVALVCLTSISLAQSHAVVPRHVATIDANSHIAEFLFFPMRTQQIIAGREFCTTNAMLTEVAFRADARFSNVWPAATFNSFELWVGHSANAVGSLSTGFPHNRTASHTQAFLGVVQRPAQPPSQNWQAHPWSFVVKFSAPFFYTRATGDLLIETSWPYAGNSFNSWSADAHSGTGTAYLFGTGGQVGGAGVVISPLDSQSVPGGFLGVIGSVADARVPATTPVVLFFGLSDKFAGPIPLPLDLTGFGAPGNKLYVSPDMTFVTSLQRRGANLHIDYALPLPMMNGLDGAMIYAQAGYVDATINALGIGFTNGLAFRIGNQTTGSQYLWGSPDSLSGVLVEHYRAPAVRLSGTFN